MSVNKKREGVRRGDWMRELYEQNERDLAPGSEFLRSIGIGVKPRREGPRKARVDEGPLTVPGRRAAASRKKRGEKR